jgi:hypothetical protein
VDCPVSAPHPDSLGIFLRRRLCKVTSGHLQHILERTWRTPTLLPLGRLELLNSMPPWMGGGEMIQDVFLDHSTCVQAVTRVATNH